MGAIDISMLRNTSFWRASFLEFIGTTIFVFLVTSVLIPPDADIVKISFAIGLSIGVLAHVFGPITGAHFNPAVTLGAVVAGTCGVIKGLVYAVAQIVGEILICGCNLRAKNFEESKTLWVWTVEFIITGIAGTAVTYGMHPSSTNKRLDALQIGAGYTIVQGFFMELILTALLVFTFLASTSSDNNRKNLGFVNALAVGLSITVAHLVGIPVTGSGINPARAFGPSLVVNQWQKYHWVYWIGPLCGGLLAGLVYRFVVQPEMRDESEHSDTAPLITSYRAMDESNLE